MAGRVPGKGFWTAEDSSSLIVKIDPW